ncbi:DnaJ domain-containing protein [Natronorubrum sp. JWXQ-INN-674]|uniref:DnaJ domain-containing protein n=1 Tax=Natronorubrum halalkaliphilum TaxID=2691917 RepID=A0A6B0VSB3_9EURY|nr:J domain-containing protein [Natronorubrum halalkaliphilum]MXV64344.1 DnaJ domain-containing protein [Natronorubrum halalkaliphilum]
MGETYYEVLGVDTDASQDEIRAAYRERVLETHPDHNDAPDAAEQFQCVSTAESVLTDGAERARYDRLGHEAYLRLAQQTTDSSSATADNSSTSHDAEETTRSSAETANSTASGRDRSRTGTHRSTTRTSHTRTGTGRTHSRTSRTGSESADQTTSHHARQRNRRQRRTTQQQTENGWPFASGGDDTTASTATSTKSGRSDGESASGFRYAVHDWDGDIDLEWDGQSIDHATAVTLGCLWALYPVLVGSILFPAFPLVVNAIVAACTLVLVGYLLTRPRFATALFGFWSLLFPLGLLLTGVSPVSITGLVALGFVWVPFGYAVALWWALQP